MKKTAYSYVRNNFIDNYLPNPAAEEKQNEQEQQQQGSVPEPLQRVSQKRKRKSALTAFLEDSDSDEEEEADGGQTSETVEKAKPPPPQPQAEEVDMYLSLPEVSSNEKDGELDVLAWWKLHQKMFPDLSKMARQYLALPASSAGVERLFSAAGRLHSSFRKNAKETTLEVQLQVYQNS